MIEHRTIEHRTIEHKPIETHEQDLRSQTTGKIWGCATGMMGICIPLSFASQSGPVLPIAVLVAAAVGTAAVWMRGGTVVVNSRGGEGADSQKRIQDLEERLASLEAITNFEHKLIEAKYPGATPVSAPPAAPSFTFEAPGGVMADSPTSTAAPSAGRGPSLKAAETKSDEKERESTGFALLFYVSKR